MMDDDTDRKDEAHRQNIADLFALTHLVGHALSQCQDPSARAALERARDLHRSIFVSLSSYRTAEQCARDMKWMSENKLMEKTKAEFDDWVCTVELEKATNPPSRIAFDDTATFTEDTSNASNFSEHFSEQNNDVDRQVLSVALTPRPTSIMTPTNQRNSFENHNQLSREINALCTQMIRSEYDKGGRGGREGNTGRHLILCHCDMTTVFINSSLRCLSGSTCNLQDIERRLAALTQMFLTQMIAINCLRKQGEKNLSETYPHVDTNQQLTLSNVLRVFSEKDADESDDDGDDEAEAFRSATNAHDNDNRKASWKAHAKLPKPVKNAFLFQTNIVAVIRVLSQAKSRELEEVLREKELNEYRHFCRVVCGQNTADLSLRFIVETGVVPALASASDELRMAARRVSSILARELVKERWDRYFAASESVPLERSLESCTSKEIEAMIRSNPHPLMSEGSRTKAETVRQRKRIALKGFFGFIHSFAAADSLRGLGAADACHLPFALLCSPSSLLRSSKFNFLMDDRIHASTPDILSIEKEFIDSVRETIKDMIKTMHSSTEVFRKTHVFADLTDDLNNGSRCVLGMFSDFFKDDVEDSPSHDFRISCAPCLPAPDS